MPITLGSKIIQDLTYTCKQLGDDIVINYINSDSLSVSVSDSTINVNIVSGVTTATQIKTALDANLDAMYLVSVTISGTGSNPQVTCKNALIANGVTTAIAASQIIGTLKYTAKTAGAAGNSIRIKYTSGSLLVSVATNDITIRFVDGVTTASAIKAAVAAEGAADALVAVVSAGAALSVSQNVASALSFINLVGGLDATPGSVIVQDLTFSTDSNTAVYNGKTITFTIGATAGAEVVTVVDGNVNVQIENGVSTATQIKAALDASADFNGIKASGSIVVSNYAQLHLTKAAGTVTFGTPDNAVKASLLSQGLTYTAKTAGPAGNSLSVEIVDTFLIDVTPGLAYTDGTDVVINIGGVGKATWEDTGILYVAKTYGTGGNSYSIEVKDTLSGGLSYVDTAGVIVIDIGGSSATSTDLQALFVATPSTHIDTVLRTSDQPLVVYSTTLLTGGGATPSTSDVVTLLSSATNIDVVETTPGNILPEVQHSLSGGLNASTITVDGNTFTKVSGAPGAGEFQVIADLTTLIDNLSSVDATDNGTVVAVVAHTAGTAGNSITMSKTGAGLTLVQLSGGINASTVTVAGHILTESTDYNATVSNDSTATSIASAVTALTEVNSTASTNTVNIVAATSGIAGNSITLATSDAVNLLKSGANLTGGTNKYECTISGTGSNAQKTVNGLQTAGAVGQGANAIYHDQSTDALTSSYVQVNFHFHANNLTLINDETSGNKTISLSWDGVNVHGSLLPGQSLSWDLQTTVTQIWLKYVNAAPNYRLYVLGS